MKKINIAGIRLAHLRYVVYLMVDGVVHEVYTPLPDSIGRPEEWLLGSGEGSKSFGSLEMLLRELGIQLGAQAVAYRMEQLTPTLKLLNEWEKHPLVW